MALKDLPVETRDGTLPPTVRRFLKEAYRRIEGFEIRGGPLAFVPSNYEAVYHQLHALSESTLARGSRFCEWGCGFGVIASMAAMLNFESCGIEIQGDLVDEAQRLAEDFGLDVAFTHGSFVPRGGEPGVHTSGTYAWLTTEGDYAYDDLGLDIDDMDVIFAYPWPDEEAVTGELFDRFAGEGALLITYHGEENFRIRRKVAERGRKRRSR